MIKIGSQASCLNCMVNDFILKKRYAALKERANFAMGLLKSCEICPRKCGVNRSEGELGYCGSGFNPAIYTYQPHSGEEPPISGCNGSGAIFFSNCNLRCLYCQNFRFSQMGEGEEISPARLAGIMLELQKKGCHNINLVTPTHFLPQIMQALYIAAERGLSIPIVYNT